MEIDIVDGAIRNIEKEILRECTNRNIQIYENFLNYYIKLLALDPRWGISTNVITNRGDVQKFIHFVVDQVKNQYTPRMVLLKMQFYFNYNYQNRMKMVQNNRVELLSKLKRILNEILEMTTLKEEKDIDFAYKKLVYYITLASGMGNPMMEDVFHEVLAALRSILNKRELKDYLAKQKFQKDEGLEDFTKLVTGIRLFNKDCSKGGEGMEDLPELITEGCEATRRALQDHLVMVMDKVNLLTTALDLAYATEIDERGNYVLVCKDDKDNMDYVKDFLVLYRQYELFIRKLEDAVDKVEVQSNTIFMDLQATLVELHQIVSHRIAIPVHQVFPSFRKLAEIWYSLQDQTVLLAKLNQIMSNLRDYVSLLILDETIPQLMTPEGQPTMTDAERLEKSTTGKFLRMEDGGHTMQDLILFKHYGKFKLEYLGFCPWKLVESQGALIPGNPNLGIVKCLNMNFVFSSLEAGKAFLKIPEKFVMQVVDLARRKPEFINFLQIQDQLDLLQEIKDLLVELPLAPITNETEVQTEIHPVETYVDKDYMWNVWDLRRKALQLANLIHCKTVSSQTDKTFFRFGARTQTQELRDKNEQTKKDNYSNVPKPSTFMFGLRGRKDDKQFIVDLTRPVEE